MKVVLDTNILIRAIFAGDKHCRQAIQYIRRGRVRAIVSHAIVDELGQKFAEIAHHEPPRKLVPVFKALGHFLAECELVNPPFDYQISPDASDNKFFACAVHGHAEVIISHDGNDVYGIGLTDDSPVRVMSAWQFCRAVKDGSVL